MPRADGRDPGAGRKGVKFRRFLPLALSLPTDRLGILAASLMLAGVVMRPRYQRRIHATIRTSSATQSSVANATRRRPLRSSATIPATISASHSSDTKPRRRSPSFLGEPSRGSAADPSRVVCRKQAVSFHDSAGRKPRPVRRRRRSRQAPGTRSQSRARPATPPARDNSKQLDVRGWGRAALTAGEVAEQLSVPETWVRAEWRADRTRMFGRGPTAFRLVCRGRVAHRAACRPVAEASSARAAIQIEAGAAAATTPTSTASSGYGWCAVTLV